MRTAGAGSCSLLSPSSLPSLTRSPDIRKRCSLTRQPPRGPLCLQHGRTAARSQPDRAIMRMAASVRSDRHWPDRPDDGARVQAFVLEAVRRGRLQLQPSDYAGRRRWRDRLSTEGMTRPRAPRRSLRTDETSTARYGFGDVWMARRRRRPAIAPPRSRVSPATASQLVAHDSDRSHLTTCLLTAAGTPPPSTAPTPAPPAKAVTSHVAPVVVEFGDERRPLSVGASFRVDHQSSHVTRRRDRVQATPKASATAAAHAPYRSTTVDGDGHSPACSRLTASPPRRRECVRDQSYDDDGAEP